MLGTQYHIAAGCVPSLPDYRMNRAYAHVYPIDPPPERHTMRSFDDVQGGHWQAALMEASFGNVIAIFSRIGGEGALRAPLNAPSMRAAEQLLADADEAWLRELLAQAKPWA